MAFAAVIVLLLSEALPLTKAHEIYRERSNAHIRAFHDHAELTARQLPAGWTAQGCYNDAVGQRTLSAATFASAAMTHELCVNFCDNAGYALAGVEYSVECYCDNWIQNGATIREPAGCNMDCAGNAAQKCGGDARISVFFSGVDPGPPPPPPTELEQYGLWESEGCYTDGAAGRTLLTATPVTGGPLTVQRCADACLAGFFRYSGVEFGVECYCGHEISNDGEPATSGCNMKCAGSNNLCGGPNRLNLYQYTGELPEPPPPPEELPVYGNWISIGCHTDAGAARALTVAAGVTGTVQGCADTCLELGTGPYRFSGVEFGGECYCGHQISNDHVPATSGCNMACTGSTTDLCGGANRINIYQYHGNLPEPPPPPTELPAYGLWESLGCYTDGPERTLPIGLGVPGSVTGCADICFDAGYPLAGVEYGGECFCGLGFVGTGVPTDSGCNMACSAEPANLCGGPNRLNVYNYTSTLPHGPIDPGVPTGPPPPPVTEGLPEPWEYKGCWIDNQFGRILAYQGLDPSSEMTVETCVDYCEAEGYELAGLQFSIECYCGHTVIQAGAPANEKDCYMRCGGDNKQGCGGPNRFSLYGKVEEVEVIPVPTTKTEDLPGSYQYAGCIAEPGAERVFPYFIYDPQGMSVDSCLERCSAFGYPAAGLEYSSECWCGDIENVEDNGGVVAPEADCSMPCVGSPATICGGVQRLSLYTWTTPPLNVWHTPANKGRYELLIGGIVIPLIATLGLNDKVSFMEKYGTGAPNSTGAYELDPSLADNHLLAWRVMHVESDVFCAGNVVLPDKAGRQLSVGGWSFESTEGVRFYTPDGAPGVNGTNDWEENWNALHLQDGRWYPTPMIMANGSILIVGGEEGSNGAPVPTLEILPAPVGGRTALYMDWLERTDPNNLYPYLFVLPGGGIFVLYYNEARILDEVTFETIKEFPIAPGNVVGGGGRTYPLEGTAVILPQIAPYTDPLRVMACGGSNFGVALDNCITIEPEGDGEWVLERMPSRRVMTNMAALPDGTYIIVGGAKAGVAGFGLATQPNLDAVLYDPFKPLHQRFSILNTTTVARMYHSEAILLADARVLVTGSDPQDGVNPQEYRMEVYYPPYLTDGRTQPELTVADNDWSYGGSYPVQITLHHGGPVKFSLLAAVSSTHGSSMGQRTLFPAFSCAGTTCTIVAPPNAHICPPGWFQLFVLDGPTPSYSKWVRIGGDPAQLGLWPDLPEFTVPGM